MNFKKLNNVGGWVAFGTALVTYLMTVEPTASFWDCGEFIACSYKLEVPHPPGAPFFLLMGRIFSFLAMGDTSQVAYWVNILSVLSSAFSILFLYWSVTHLAGKILKTTPGAETPTEKILLIGAGFVAALTCTFSDSFWFSAVEAEVYGMSSFFTAFVFWAILKWENKETDADRHRWLILIAYMMGLSLGVHILNLVTIPALGLIIYFKYNKEVTSWGIIGTLLVALGIVGFITAGIITGLPSVAGGIEILFVNSFGLPFGSGIIFFSLLFIGGLVYGIYYSIQKKKYILNTALMSLAFIMIGYSSYAIVLIRSGYNPPIDENNPEDIMSFVSYLKREQYGSRPLFHGQYYTAPILKTEKGAKVYMKGENEYVLKEHKLEYVYDPEHTTILPRIYSSDPNHVKKYREVTGLRPNEKPSFGDNLKFLFQHQIGYMYMRYFMWNFSGREHDIQGANWISGIGESEENLPDSIRKNAGRNTYYMLPLFLGLLGLFIQFQKSPTYFSATTLLFILTGVALVVYLNSPPTEPRERDYIYAGSYYAFAMWVGFGVIGLYELFKSAIKNLRIAAVLASLTGVGIPTLMASENWDDHDRSGRYFSLAAARNYLDSCAPNAILFTGGDNDTFPLWYLQEVEGYRTDVRVIVLSYFNTDWYIDQMMRPAYESKPLPFGLEKDQYIQGGLNDIIYVTGQYEDNPINFNAYYNLLKANDQRIQIETLTGKTNTIPSSRLVWSGIDIEKAKKYVPEYLHEYLTTEISWRLKRSYLEKKDLAILDLILNTNWERPIYFNYTSKAHFNIDISANLVQEGICYRVLPVQAPRINGRDVELINRQVMYDNMMNKFTLIGKEEQEVYYSEDYRGFCQNLRSAYNILAEELIVNEEYDKAGEVLRRCIEFIPHEAVPYDYFSVIQVSQLLEIGEKELALDIANKSAENSKQMLDWMISRGETNNIELTRHAAILSEIARAYRVADDKENATKFQEIFFPYAGILQQ